MYYRATIAILTLTEDLVIKEVPGKNPKEGSVPPLTSTVREIPVISTLKEYQQGIRNK